MVRHYGETDGMSSIVALLPQEKLGVVILTNLHTTTLHTALLYRIFDGMLNAPTEDWRHTIFNFARKRRTEIEIRRNNSGKVA